MTGYALLIPEGLLIAGVLWAMFAELLPGGDRGAVSLGALTAASAAVLASLQPTGATLFGGMLVFDGPARTVRVSVALLGAVWLLWLRGRGEGRQREAVALALFTLVGSMLMGAARELVTLTLAIELATMPAYVLIGYRKREVRGLEGALKYFLLSMLTSLIMLYGFSFLYGVSGSTFLAEMDLRKAGAMGLLAVLFSFVGLFAKLSAAPFHYWAPDAYEGADAAAVAFVSTVPKVAGALATVRLAAAVVPTRPEIASVLAVVAVASMLLGNLAALTQTDMRRLMAYSGVAHSGYLLLGAAAVSAVGYSAAVFYAVAYAFPTMGLLLLAAEEGSAIDDLAGLAARRPAAAWGSVVLLLSLIGIPPLVGFFGKLTLFTAALEAHLAVAVLIAVAMSVVSAAYYLRVVRAAFFTEAPAGREALPARPLAALALALCVALTVGLGLAAGPALRALGTLVVR